MKLLAVLVAVMDWIGEFLLKAYVTGFEGIYRFIEKLSWKFFNFVSVKDERGIFKARFKEFMADTWGVEKSLIQVVIVLAVLMLSVLIVAPLQDQSEKQVSKINDTNTQQTWSDIKSATWGALSMFTIVPYVVVFVVIIGLILLIAKKAD